MTYLNVQSQPPASGTSTNNWREWNPGLSNDELSLRAVFDTLPEAGPDEIEQMLRLLQHPSSPYAKSPLERLRSHDCIHILLGRGLLNQDVAFVLGYTMGSAKDHPDDQQVQQFRSAARLLYKPPYRMTENDLTAFDVAFAVGNASGYRHIHQFDFDQAMDVDLGDVRQELGIDIKALKASFREERLLLPGNKASERLPII